MYISNIHLKNIRGFKELKLDLDRGGNTYAGWTVFTGGNGSGKSTILKAVAIGLAGASDAPLLQPSFNGWIRNAAGVSDASTMLEVVPVPDDDSAKDKPFRTRTRIGKLGRHDVVEEGEGNGSSRIMWKPRERDFRGWLSCGYGPFRRVFGASADALVRMEDPVTTRFVTLFHESASLTGADEWARELNYKRIEGKVEETKQLDLLLRFLRDDLLPYGVTVDRIDSDGLWLLDKAGTALTWNDMSDGFRSALALLTDILRHLISAYGIDGLAETNDDGSVYIDRSGVVLIDEIDAHLHPEWQRTIGFWLKRHFPKIQFLVTTHSPLICQAADPNGLFVLPDPASEEMPRALSSREYQSVIASRPDTLLLSPAFGLENTRSPFAVGARAEFAKLAAKRRAGVPLSDAEAGEEEALRRLAVTDEEL
jgi:energy-coupling factor transporter ATP-binding protein EcfA2